MPPTDPSPVIERWMARSVRVLWWVGGLVLVLGLVGDVDYAAGSGYAPFVGVCCLSLILAYVTSSRYPTAGLTAACVVGTVLSVVAHQAVADTIFTTWASLVFISGVATLRAPVTHLPWLAGAVPVTVLVTGHLMLDEMLLPGLLVLAPLMALSVGAGGWQRLQHSQRERALIDSRVTERAEIARELHDVVAHHVTAIVVRAQAGQFSSDPDAPRAALAAIESEGAAAMAAMRRMVASLRSAETLTLSTDMAAELDQLATTLRAAGFTVEETVEEMPTALAPTIVRLTREAYTNVRKHAVGATWVRLSVRIRADAVCWSVIDNGRPAGRTTNPGFGLVGLQERVEALGGTFGAGPHPDGWEVRADLPRGVPV